MKRLIQFSAMLSVVFFSIFMSCTYVSDNDRLLYPQEGVQCYQTNEKEGVSHLKLSISEREVKGILLFYDEVSGNIYYDFSGEVINDSLYNINIHYLSDKIEQQWTLKINADHLEISGISLADTKLEFSALPCDKFPDISLYYSMEDIEKDNEGEAYENPELNCFYMYYPSGAKRTMIREYIQVRNRNGVLSGLGAGSSEGDADWSFSFKGHFTQGDTAEITGVYKREGEDAFVSNETWIINFEQNTLKLDKSKPTDLRVFGNGEFHKIDCSAIEEWATELINSH